MCCGAIPIRAEQLAASRADKQATVEQLRQDRNRYLEKHPRAKVATAEKSAAGQDRATENRGLAARCRRKGAPCKLTVNQPALEEASRLDGCYVIKTDLPASAASKQVVHDRYKELTLVEQAFRTCKTAHLETRPIYVRTAEHTRGHVLVVMLAYLIRRELSRAWTSLDVTVEEGLHQLQTLCSIEVKVTEGGSCLRIPTPSPCRSRFAPSAEDPLAGSTPSHRCSCSHAQETARTPQTPLRNSRLPGKNCSASEVNIRCGVCRQRCRKVHSVRRPREWRDLSMRKLPLKLRYRPRGSNAPGAVCGWRTFPGRTLGRE